MPIYEMADQILASATHSLTWGDLTTEERERFTKIANLSERIKAVIMADDSPAVLTLAHAANM